MPKLRSRIFDKFILNPTCEPLATSDEPRAQIMQNKPNLLDTQMNVTFSFTKYYENEQLRIRRKNKAKTNPTCGEPACTELCRSVEPTCGEQAQRVEPFMVPALRSPVFQGEEGSLSNPPVVSKRSTSNHLGHSIFLLKSVLICG
jgi:hypothetical protein